MLDWRLPFVFHTSRLQASPASLEAAGVFAEIIADPWVREPYFAGRLPNSTSHADTAIWLQTAHRWQEARRFSLAFSLRDDGAVIGGVQFTPRGIGYFVARRFWRQGLGREMVAASCSHLPPMLGIELLDATVMRENFASRRILEQCGFAFVGMAMHTAPGQSGRIAMLRYRRRFS
jgi:RimJ/RimL family protein N-acetyltransferase